MHDYAIFGHDRANIGRWLGFAAIAIAGGVGQFLTTLTNLTGWSAFSSITVTTGIVYLLLHWIFNKWVWKKTPWLDIPDLTGVWSVDGKTLTEDGQAKYEWTAKLDINQTWKQILVGIETASSQSESYTATLVKRHGARGGWVLSYSYRNEPNLEQSHELNAHKGFCEVEIDKDLKIGKATYFNSGGRRTYGIMHLTKEGDK